MKLCKCFSQAMFFYLVAGFLFIVPAAEAAVFTWEAGSDSAVGQIMEQAEEEMSAGNAQKAADLYSGLLLQYPQEDEIRSYRGAAYFALGDLDRAMEDFNRVLETSPDSMQANYYMGLIDLRWGNTDSAKEYLDRALALSKESSEKSAVLDVMGQMAAFQKDYKKALTLFTDSIVAEENYSAYFRRAKIYRMMHDVVSAEKDYTRLTELYPKEAEPYHQLGLCKGQFEIYGAALEEFNKAIALKPDCAEYYNDRGYTYACQGDFVSAIEDYTKAIELDEKYALAYANRAFAYEKTKEKEKARMDRAIAENLAEFGEK